MRPSQWQAVSLLRRCRSGCYLLVFLSALAVFLPSAGAQSARLVHEGREYLDLATAGARLGMRAYWLRGYEIFRLRSQWTNIDAAKGQKRLYLNGTAVHLGFPTRLQDGRLYLAQADFRHVLQSILTPQVFPDRPELRRIVLDPGHGGADSGAAYPAFGVEEKSLNLDIARRLRTLLEGAGYEVVLTREDDQFVPLERRGRIARFHRADLFLSIHFNAAENPQASGYETFILTPQYQASTKFPRPTARDNRDYPGNAHDAWNTLLGYHLQHRLARGSHFPDRGLKRARFAVLKELECPGALVELGFLSHAASARRIRSEAYRAQIAQNLFEGIRDYGERLQRIP